MRYLPLLAPMIALGCASGLFTLGLIEGDTFALLVGGLGFAYSVVRINMIYGRLWSQR